jgi:hypothetical protein
MIYNFFRRGVGLFRLLFVIDDMFRLITLSILLPVFINWLGFHRIFVLIAFAVGLVLDIYDFAKEVGPGMTLSVDDFNIFYLYQNGKGIKDFLFAVHDLLQMAAMTILISLFFTWIGIEPPYLLLGVALGVIIDVHDFTTEFGGGRVSVEEE